jgi:hypothetical protein
LGPNGLGFCVETLDQMPFPQLGEKVTQVLSDDLLRDTKLTTKSTRE